jgi:hypothetical protein
MPYRCVRAIKCMNLVWIDLVHLSNRLPPTPAPKRDASLAKVRQAFEEQRTTLPEQQQVLTALVQEYTKLLTLQREYQQLVEES